MGNDKKTETQYEIVDASPVKSFFVSMLTRDITLEEAILDLLDNCVDGIQRSRNRRKRRKPYEGFWAKIEFDKDVFRISDNCGGIPWELHDYAFRMGRHTDSPEYPAGSVGVYGIGMKRAIFKIGKRCSIYTQNKNDRYEIKVDPEWLANEDEWKLPVKPAEPMNEDGTSITVKDLYPGIKDRFTHVAQAFKKDLNEEIATHYAFIINKGFEVRINGEIVKPRPTRLVFDEKPRGRRREAVQPFIYKTVTDDGVEVFLTVGFTGPMLSEDEIADEHEKPQVSSIGAGWTVVCNERAVLYCDRSELTGWGVAGIPRYHTQFIRISGIVEFKADNASLLPMTTIKRGIVATPLYLQIKDKMREGMRIFIDYTNKWRGRVQESKKYIENKRMMSFEEIKKETENLPLTTTTRPAGKQYKPNLPSPKKLGPRKRSIAFVKNLEEVKCVAVYLFDDEDADPSTVGEECFDRTLEEARG